MPSASNPSPTSWTPLKLVAWTTGYFNDHGIDGARTEAEVLLAHTLGTRRIDLYLNYDQPLCDDELARFKAVVKRRVDHEPVAYITGTREFWSLELMVNRSVLIPRPETECLVEAVLPFLDHRTGPPKRVLDLGTGSGAIVIALAHEHPRHRYLAMDRSAAAVRTARQNAGKHHLDHRIDWFCGDWNAALATRRRNFDLIVSNPPYIRSGDMEGLQPEIRHYEPGMALDGSTDGLTCLRRIVEAGHRHLRTGGRIALEIGCDQAEAVLALAEATGRYRHFRIVKDYSGLDRVVVFELKA
ncbi:MAG: peptide chain release factor N(5)-glutamine methyltransferase [Desulfosarcina sp.]